MATEMYHVMKASAYYFRQFERVNCISLRFVFMALMEYCLVNIILGDSDAPKPPPDPPKAEKVFDMAAKVN